MVGDVDHVGWLRRYAAGVRSAARTAGDVHQQREMQAMARRLVEVANELEAQRGMARTREVPFGDYYARVEEVAERLGLATETVRRLMRLGRMRGEKMGNVWLMRRADLEELARDYSKWGRG